MAGRFGTPVRRSIVAASCVSASVRATVPTARERRPPRPPRIVGMRRVGVAGRDPLDRPDGRVDPGAEPEGDDGRGDHDPGEQAADDRGERPGRCSGTARRRAPRPRAGRSQPGRPARGRRGSASRPQPTGWRCAARGAERYRDPSPDGPGAAPARPVVPASTRPRRRSPPCYTPPVPAYAAGAARRPASQESSRCPTSERRSRREQVGPPPGPRAPSRRRNAGGVYPAGPRPSRRGPFSCPAAAEAEASGGRRCRQP